MKTPTIERFDRTAQGYQRWWAPVLAPSSARLVERIDLLDPGLSRGEQRRVLDLGCGTGNLIFQAARNWPGARITGLDASSGMLAVAAHESQALPVATRDRLSFVQAFADSIPLPDGSLDLAMTAFVVQQVPDRPAVLREFHRVLAPGGYVAIYGWLAGWEFAADAELESALAEAGVVRPADGERRAGHYRSVRHAADELRAAGFRQVSPRPEVLGHAWTAADFIDYHTTTRDLDVFEAMDAPTRAKVLASLRRRLAVLTADQMVDRTRIISITARKP